MKKNIYNYNKLFGLMVEKGYTQKHLAEALHKNECTLSAKFNNLSDFKASEISQICDLLEIPAEQMATYFFSR
jgi:transcriptional regulator with XRE-family HTH domain